MQHETDSRPVSVEQLTSREREVLTLIGRGYTLPEIAEMLCRSLKTIETHRASLGRKLQVSNRVELARVAIRAGLAPLIDEDAAGDPPASAGPDQARSALEVCDIVEEATTDRTGGAYFRELLRTLARELGVRASLLFEHRGEELVGMTCVEQDRIIDPPLAVPDQCPTWQTFREGSVVIPRGLPRGRIERTMEWATAYCGTRLDRPDHPGLGVLAVVHDRPLADPDIAADVLRVVARRAAAELERHRMAEQLRELQEQLEDRIEESTTALQSAIETIREREQYYRTLVETMSDGLAITDAENVVTYVNQRFCEFTGYTQEQAVGRSAAEFLKPEQAKVHASLQADRESDALRPWCLDLRRADGSYVQVRSAPRAIYSATGRYLGNFSIMTPLDDVQQAVERTRKLGSDQPR